MSGNTNNTSVTSDIDIDALRNKYREERDKRLNSSGIGQYQKTQGEFAAVAEDPYIESTLERAPLTDEVDVVIIGGGFGGLLAGVQLRKQGVKDIRIIEKAGDFGGTWYWNRYPGAQCDVESYVYLPLLEEMGYMPKEKYSHGPEILDHAKAIGKKFDLYDNVCFQTQVMDLRWEEKSSRWIIYTNRDDQIKARFIVLSNGPLNTPKLPGIDGISSFKGTIFHTSRWDYDYTGGDSTGNLTKLKDKKVGIIGTGATAVQCIPHLGEWAKELYVFQRTPSSIDVRNNRPTDDAWVETLEPGWQKRRMENFTAVVSGLGAEEDLVADGWTDIFRNVLRVQPAEGEKKFTMEEMEAAIEVADFHKMEQVRGRVNTMVSDEVTAEGLKPYYRQFCKRPCFHDEYLQTYERPNVTLVNTDGQGVESVTDSSVLAIGEEYELDCLIFATGFEVGTNYTSQCGYEVTGSDNIKLSEKWANGFKTYHGMHSRGFPNCMFMGFTQGALTANVPHTLLEQAMHLAYIISHSLDEGLTKVEASQQAEEQWVATINSMSFLGDKFFKECTPGYYNNEGQHGSGNGFLQGQYGAGPTAFFRLLEEWREEKSLKGLELETA